jgi:hypothetical protein
LLHVLVLQSLDTRLSLLSLDREDLLEPDLLIRIVKLANHGLPIVLVLLLRLQELR